MVKKTSKKKYETKDPSLVSAYVVTPPKISATSGATAGVIPVIQADPLPVTEVKVGNGIVEEKKEKENKDKKDKKVKEKKEFILPATPEGWYNKIVKDYANLAVNVRYRLDPFVAERLGIAPEVNCEKPISTKAHPDLHAVRNFMCYDALKSLLDASSTRSLWASNDNRIVVGDLYGSERTAHGSPWIQEGLDKANIVIKPLYQINVPADVTRYAAGISLDDQVRLLSQDVYSKLGDCDALFMNDVYLHKFHGKTGIIDTEFLTRLFKEFPKVQVVIMNQLQFKDHYGVPFRNVGHAAHYRTTGKYVEFYPDGLDPTPYVHEFTRDFWKDGATTEIVWKVENRVLRDFSTITVRRNVSDMETSVALDAKLVVEDFLGMCTHPNFIAGRNDESLGSHVIQEVCTFSNLTWWNFLFMLITYIPFVFIYGHKTRPVNIYVAAQTFTALMYDESSQQKRQRITTVVGQYMKTYYGATYGNFAQNFPFAIGDITCGTIDYVEVLMARRGWSAVSNRFRVWGCLFYVIILLNAYTRGLFDNAFLNGVRLLLWNIVTLGDARTASILYTSIIVMFWPQLYFGRHFYILHHRFGVFYSFFSRCSQYYSRLLLKLQYCYVISKNYWCGPSAFTNSFSRKIHVPNIKFEKESMTNGLYVVKQYICVVFDFFLYSCAFGNGQYYEYHDEVEHDREETAEPQLTPLVSDIETGIRQQESATISTSSNKTLVPPLLEAIDSTGNLALVGTLNVETFNTPTYKPDETNPVFFKFEVETRPALAENVLKKLFTVDLFHQQPGNAWFNVSDRSNATVLNSFKKRLAPREACNTPRVEVLEAFAAHELHKRFSAVLARQTHVSNDFDFTSLYPYLSSHAIANLVKDFQSNVQEYTTTELIAKKEDNGKEIFMEIIPKYDESHYRGVANPRVEEDEIVPIRDIDNSKLRTVCNFNKKLCGVALMKRILEFNVAMEETFKNAGQSVLHSHEKFSILNGTDLEMTYIWAPVSTVEMAQDELRLRDDGNAINRGICLVNGDDMKAVIRLGVRFFVICCDFSSYDISIGDYIMRHEAEDMGDQKERYIALHSLDWKCRLNGMKIVMRHSHFKINRPSGTPNTSSANTKVTIVATDLYIANVLQRLSCDSEMRPDRINTEVESLIRKHCTDAALDVFKGLGFRPKVNVYFDLEPAEYLKNVNINGIYVALPSRNFKTLSCIKNKFEDYFSSTKNYSRELVGNAWMDLYASGMKTTPQNFIDQAIIARYGISSVNVGNTALVKVMGERWIYRAQHFENETPKLEMTADWDSWVKLFRLRYNLTAEDALYLQCGMEEIPYAKLGEDTRFATIVNKILAKDY